MVHSMVRRFLGSRSVGLGLLLLATTPLLAQGEDEFYRDLLRGGQRKLDRGQIGQARADFEELLAAAEEEAPPDRPSPELVRGAQLGLLAIERRSGAFAAVREALAGWSAEHLAEPGAALLLASARRGNGDYAGALAALTAAAAAHPDDLQVRFEIAELHHADGRRAQAKELWQALADAARDGDAAVRTWRARAMLRLGGRANLERASQLLVDALASPDAPVMARITLGELKYTAYGEAAGFPSGERDLRKVLDDHGDVEAALLALYRIRSSNMLLDPQKTEELLDRALAQNPNCVAGIALRAANVLGDRRFGEAARMFDAALAIDPNDRTVLAHRAAAAYVARDERYEEFRRRALAGDPGWPDADRILADHLATLYRFADAVPFYRAALAAAPDDVPSLHGLAKALVYTGRGVQAKELLQRAKALEAGYVDPWRNNSIAVQELLEQQYVVVQNERFALHLHRDDHEVLAAYLMPVLLEAAETLGSKYQYVPGEPVTVETLHTWDDFSVRTIGFRGFTALGACFGKLVTLVSPRDVDLRTQDFMWEATAWHEYAHVLTLGVSRHRVPRWLTEGFSVYEERQRNPIWERGMDRELFDAYHNQDIPPVRLLNRLFRGPRILFGYYQGGLLVELIARRYGFDKALALLAAYGEDLDLEAAFEKALGVPSARLDQQLLELVRDEKLAGMRLVPRYDDNALQRLTSRAAQDQSNLQVRIDLAWACLQRDNPVDAGRWLAEVLRAQPEHGQAQLVRAELLRRRGDLDGAILHWQKGFASGADDFDSRLAAGDALRDRGDLATAIAMYEAAKRCWPNCTEQSSAPELRLARLYRDQEQQQEAQREIRAYCKRTARAFTPRYTLAEFARQAGDRQEELQLLLECNQIDPFFRELHVRLGEAYAALGKPALAAREFEVAAAVLPSLDRKFQRGGAPAADDPAELEERCGLWLRAATLRNELGDRERAERLVQRLLTAGPDTPAAAGARALQELWRGR